MKTFIFKGKTTVMKLTGMICGVIPVTWTPLENNAKRPHSQQYPKFHNIH